MAGFARPQFWRRTHRHPTVARRFHFCYCT
jgi:hypothetical protein